MRKFIALVALLAVGILAAACAQPTLAPPTTSASPRVAASPTVPPAGNLAAADVYALVKGQPRIPDPPAAYPQGELGRLVRLGEDLVYHTHTAPLTKDLVGNDLDCTSCHLDGGKAKTLGTFIGSAAAFPAYSPREQTVQTLQDRIDNCFMRSMNGTRPAVDSEASLAITAYITWLSSGLPIAMNAEKPINPFYTHLWVDKKLVPLAKSATHLVYLDGKHLYAQKCAACHGEDGQGKEGAPPLWGDRAFNSGAGLAQPVKMATWLQYNMPPDGSKLSAQDAVALAIYVDAQPHPDFSLQAHLPPQGQAGVYNARVQQETRSVAQNFAALGLDVRVLITGQGVPDIALPTPTPTPAAASFDAAAFYASSCAVCHGAHAEGGIAPPLDKAASQQDAYVHIILQGKEAMPAFQDKLSPAQALQLVEWLANK